MSYAFGMRAIAVRRQAVRRAVAAAALAHVTFERSGDQRPCTRRSRAEETGLLAIERQRQRKIVSGCRDAPTPAGDLDEQWCEAIGHVLKRSAHVVVRACARPFR